MRCPNRRRLSFETLESRELLAVLRVAGWNTFNLPNTATDDANYGTVLTAIATEAVQGTAKRADLLALVETDPPSAMRIENLLNGLHGVGTYDSVVSSLDGGGDATGFVFDSTTLLLLGMTEVPGALTHRVLRGHFRPAGTIGEADFYSYVIHLKSGATAADATTRAQEMQLIRQNADALGEGTHVIYAGDFNMHTSSEHAWANATAIGVGQGFDTANAPGDWSGNAAFQLIHTHSTATMDSRFDFQFVSGELLDNTGLEYIAGSVHAFGNNGTHGLGNPITNGTALTPAVRTALAAASDHLPVLADYSLVPTVPVILSQTGGTTSVAEGGATDSISVVLGQVPTANVTVTISPPTDLGIGSGAGTARTLTFTPANGLIPQGVTVQATDDPFYEGTELLPIVFSVTSLDPIFQSYSVPNVPVQILDNDLPKLLINELDSDTPGTDNREFVELYDGGVGNFPLDGLSLILFNGGGFANGAFDLDGYSTDANGFFVAGNPLVAGVDLEFSPGTLQNGPDAAALYWGDPADITVVTTQGLLDALVYGTNDSDDPALLVLLLPNQPQVNESGNGSSATDALSRVPDGGTQRATTSYALRGPTPGVRNAPATGDFDTDGDFDCLDIDALVARISTGSVNTTYDLIPDGVLNSGDLGLWLALAGNANLPSHAPFRFGDANLDGVVDGSDFGAWNANKFTSRPAWCSGDFTADGTIDGSDFGVWNSNKFTSSDSDRPAGRPLNHAFPQSDQLASDVDILIKSRRFNRVRVPKPFPARVTESRSQVARFRPYRATPRSSHQPTPVERRSRARNTRQA